MGIRTFAGCGQESSYAPPPIRAAGAASSSLRLAAVTQAAAPSARRRSTLVHLAMLVALALLVATVWAFGGFKKRTDILRPEAPGQPFTSGPYEFSFSEATVQRTKLDGVITWKVTVLGQGRTTGKEAISPSFVESFDGMFVLKDPVTGQIVAPDGQQYGSDTSFSRHNFTPGLPLIPYTLSFTLDEHYQPGPVLRFGAGVLVYSSHFLTTEEKTWHNGTYITLILLPVRVLPPAKD
jgi:hypothetical protein